MLDKISRAIGSGKGDDKVTYDLTVGFDGMEVEQVQADAMSFYVWKVQRTIREASDEERAEMLENGIHLHASAVGKPVISTEKLVNNLSDEQAEKALEKLMKRLGKV